MKRNSAYIPESSAFPHLGLNTLQPSNQLQPNFSPRLRNVDMVKGLVTKRTGYTALGSALDGPVIGLVEFETLNESKRLVAFTTKSQYVLDQSSGSAVWTDISPTVKWSGSEEDWLDWTIAFGLDGNGVGTKWLIATNGKDCPVYWDGIATKFKQWKPDIDDFKTCRTIRLFFNHLVLGNVTTSKKFGQQVVWGETQSLIKFGNANNLSGTFVIPGVRGEFIRAEVLGDRLALYTQDSVTLITYVGGTNVYSAETVTTELRLLSGRSVINLGSYHLFLSQENVFLFDGSRTLRRVGELIYRDYKDQLYLPENRLAFAFHDVPKQHVYFTIPVENLSEHLTYKLEYDLYNPSSDKWTVHEFGDRPTSMGYYSREDDLFFNSQFCQNTNFEDANFPFNLASTKKGFPVKVFGDDQGQVYLVDETAGTDNAGPTVSYWDSRDFTVPQGFLSELGRWIELEIELRGNMARVYYSKDAGEGYVFVQELTLQNDWRKYRVPIDVISKELRVRIQNGNLNSFFELRTLGAWVTPAGPTSGDVE